MRDILINVEPYEKRVAIVNRGALEEFQVERRGQERLAGNIYKAVVESIVPGIGAIFANIGTGKNGFLYMKDLEEKNFQMLLEEEVVIEKRSQTKKDFLERLKKGQELIVQVVKEPIGTKGPLITTDISMPGKYLVLMPFDNTIGISKRIIDKHARARLKSDLESISIPGGMGCIARTHSAGANKRQLKLEMRYLVNLWMRIQSRASRQRAPSLVYEEYDLPLRIIRDYFDGDVSKILVDSKEEYRKISRFANSIEPQLRKKIFFYRGKTPLFERYGVEKSIDNIFRRKVFLKSGGHIVIEKTEGLVAIDVNTGKFTGKRDPEETSFKTNMEAAETVARQTMLRDLSGIIVIDFIDMRDRRHRKALYDTLENAFKRDKAKVNISAVSAIGLVEMTRQRVRKTLESVSFRECPYCNGLGRVKTPMTVSIEISRKIQRPLSETRSRELAVIVHPDVAECLGASFANVLHSLEKKYRKKISVKQDSKLHVEDVYFE